VNFLRGKNQIIPLSLAVAVIFTACGGSELGNPLDIFQDPKKRPLNWDRNRPSPVQILSNRFCEKLDRCGLPLEQEKCSSGMLPTKEISSALQLERDRFPLMGSVIDSVQRGELILGEYSLKCNDKVVESLSCDETAIDIEFDSPEEKARALLLNGLQKNQDTCQFYFIAEIRKNDDLSGSCRGHEKATIFSEIGSGTKSNPHLICTAAQFVNIGSTREALKRHYALGADLDLSQYTEFADSTQFRPIGSEQYPFAGVFDGGGHQLSNLKYQDAESDAVGLFGVIRGGSAVVKNLKLRNVHIEGRFNVGSIAGKLEWGAKLYNSSATGIVDGRDQSGGLVGVANNGAVISSSSADVQTGKGASDRRHVGGLTGQLQYSSQILNSFATGSVYADYNVGGLVGSAKKSLIKNSYATGDVLANGLSGGLLASGEANIESSFALGNVSGRSNDAENIGALVGGSSSTLIDAYYYGNCVNFRTGVGCNTIGQKADEVSFFYISNPNALVRAWEADWDHPIIWDPSSKALPLHLSERLHPEIISQCDAIALRTLADTGIGTPEVPYLVCSVSQFLSMSSVPGHDKKFFELLGDLDFSGQTIVPTEFMGRIDGNGHRLTGITINGDRFVGLFSQLNGAVVTGLHLVEPQISGRQIVGGIAGGARETGSVITNSVVEGGRISAFQGHAGGIIAYFPRYNGMNNVFSSAYVEARTDGVEAETRSGGIVGDADGVILKSATRSSVYGFAPINAEIGYAIGYSGLPTDKIQSEYSSVYFDTSSTCPRCGVDNQIGQAASLDGISPADFLIHWAP